MRTRFTVTGPSTTSTTSRPWPPGGEGAGASCGATGAGMGAGGSRLTHATAVHVTIAMQMLRASRRNTGNVELGPRLTGMFFMRAWSIISLLALAGCTVRLPRPGELGIAMKTSTRIEARVHVQGQAQGQVQVQ